MEEPGAPLLPKCVASTAVTDGSEGSRSPYESSPKGTSGKEDSDKPNFSNYFKDAEWYSCPSQGPIGLMEYYLLTRVSGHQMALSLSQTQQTIISGHLFCSLHLSRSSWMAKADFDSKLDPQTY